MANSSIIYCNAMGGGDICKVSFNYGVVGNLISRRGGIR